MNNNFLATAFLSCSLREEDEPFIKYIKQILNVHKIKVTGTVGRYSVAPENPVETMRNNIKNSDFTVIVATSRYIQRDNNTNARSNGLSEMIHVESGMSYMENKPVVVFVKKIQLLVRLYLI